MSEMVERVARALAAAEFYQFPETDKFIEANWHQFAPELAERYRIRARAAIAAMREPTEVMVEAGYQPSGFEPSDVGVSHEDASDLYQAMIDAALAEETKP